MQLTHKTNPEKKKEYILVNSCNIVVITIILDGTSREDRVIRIYNHIFFLDWTRNIYMEERVEIQTPI